MGAPERIWLQDAGDYDHAAQFEVTWCAEPQDDADTEYIRADLPPALADALALPEIAAMVEAAKNVVAACRKSRMVPRPGSGVGGMTIDANIRGSVYMGVDAWPVEELDAALTAIKKDPR